MRTFERTCSTCPTLFTPPTNGRVRCFTCQPAKPPKVQLPRIKPCQHCSVPFKWVGAQVYCTTCRPIGDKEATRILNEYHLSRDEWDAMAFEQDFLCAICRLWGATHIDHAHWHCPQSGKSCGKCIRGLLCNGCNLSIAKWENNPEANRLFLPLPAFKYIELTNGIVRRRVLGPQPPVSREWEWVVED